jgi:hypothetical protein
MKALSTVQSVLLLLIGVVSLFMTLSIVFDLFGIREKEGNYVLFVVYANLLCGTLYVATVFTNWKKNYKWSFILLALAFMVLVVAFYFFKEHIAQGGIYEPKTVKAMSFRTLFTLIMAGISLFLFRKHPQLK